MDDFMERLEAAKHLLGQSTQSKLIAFVHPENMIALRADIQHESMWCVVSKSYQLTNSIQGLELLTSKLVPFGVIRLISKGHTVDVPLTTTPCHLSMPARPHTN